MDNNPHGNEYPITVYVVSFHIAYEGESLCAVFSTEDKAKKFILTKDPEWTVEKSKYEDDVYVIDAMILDQ